MFSFGFQKKIEMPTPEEALKGRGDEMKVSTRHYVNGHAIKGPFPDTLSTAYFGMGCFWGAERRFWQTRGVYATAVGYTGGYTLNPNYEEVCSGMTGHNEVVKVVYDSTVVSYEELLQVFWESHDPTQGMRQGNDCGTQYRSGIYATTEQQLEIAKRSQKHYQQQLNSAGHGKITTELLSADTFYYAEDYHQQYLAKNPNGYCGLGGTGVRYKLDKPQPAVVQGDLAVAL